MRDIMKVTLGVLADFASISADGKLNIMGIFNQVNPTSLPASILTPFLVLKFEAEITEVDTPRTIVIKLVDADGSQLLSGEQEITLKRPDKPGVRPNFNLFTRFPALVLPKAGDYSFEIIIDKDHKFSVPLRVNEVKERSS
ncbi:MAG: hypothetical protein IH867_11335 [Chloroflexi bacterium]|nr:hypothetical protein [Chloroflexota bacterium]